MLSVHVLVVADGGVDFGVGEAAHVAERWSGTAAADFAVVADGGDDVFGLFDSVNLWGDDGGAGVEGLADESVVVARYAGTILVR